MPIYEYHCERCGDFDVMQKITANPLRKCPTCKSKVRKLMSNTAFQLRGTGWYVTDYANKGKKSESSEGKSETPKPEASADSTAASEKPAEKPAAKSKKSSGKGESAAA